MKIARLACLAFAAVMAMSLVAVSAASAVEPLFKPTGATITATSGTAKLTAASGTETVTCSTSNSSGTVTSSLLALFIVHFLGCTSAGSGGSGCAVNSAGAASGLILTTTLHGILGTVLPSNAVGLLLLPISGKRFVTLVANACTIETAVTGTVAGLVEPTGKLSTTGKLIFGLNGTKQSITHIDLTHGLGLVKPALTAFSTEATEEVSASITFSPATEVT